LILKLSHDITPGQLSVVKSSLEKEGLAFRETDLAGQRALILLTNPSTESTQKLSRLEGVDEAVSFDKEYKLASRAYQKEGTLIDVNGRHIGGKAINIVAGPCSIESEEQIFQVAEFLSKLGVKFIRGGAYKPRTSPYRFQGMGYEGLKLIKKAADAYDLLVVTEVLDSSLIEEVYPYADILQVGSRNMQNFYFLKQLGKVDKPVLLKRGMYARAEEWLMAAEYILTEGNPQVILCERGIRTFDTSVRNTMDVAAIPLVKSLSHLPVWADPSHGTGRRDLVTPMAMAAVAAGADGLVMEIHPNPEKAFSDGPQSLYLHQFSDLLQRVAPVAKAVGRHLDTTTTSSITVEKQNICAE
jgi:3-deoxy-7-phosphoheptulonate synthase